MSGTTATFTYSSGTGTSFYWNSGSNVNWVSGIGPGPGIGVIVNGDSLGDISIDNFTSLTITSLSISNYAPARGSGLSSQPGIVEIAAGDTLSVTGAISGNGTIDLIGQNTTLEAGITQLGGPSINFDLNAASVPEEIVLTGSLSPGQIVTDTGPLGNFYQGDTIDFRAFTNITTVVAGSQLQVVGDLAGGGTAEYVFNAYQSPITVFNYASDGANGALLEATCFAEGSHILTPEGERAVETLREGDLVVTSQDGVLRNEPIVWVGRLRIELSRQRRREMVAPIRIRRGAFADQVPHRDLLLSPEHCVFVDGVLVPTKCLVNDMTIVQEFARPVVDYYHIETNSHAVVLAEGLPVETYLDTGNRAIFENSGAAVYLHPEFHINGSLRHWNVDSCAPLASEAGTIEPIWRRLIERAQLLGYAPAEREITTDPAPRLLVGGKEVAPVVTEPRRALFVLPAAVDGGVTLLSRSGSPADLAPWRNDHRRLGVAVRRIVVRDGDVERVIAADDPSLRNGWHPVEGGGTDLWRWTDGRGWIPLVGIRGAAVIEMQLCCEMTYCVPPEATEQAAA